MKFIKRMGVFVKAPSHSRTITSLIVFIILIAIPLTVIIAQQQQETRQRASESDALEYFYTKANDKVEPAYYSCSTTYYADQQQCEDGDELRSDSPVKSDTDKTENDCSDRRITTCSFQTSICQNGQSCQKGGTGQVCVDLFDKQSACCPKGSTGFCGTSANGRCVKSMSDCAAPTPTLSLCPNNQTIDHKVYRCIKSDTAQENRTETAQRNGTGGKETQMSCPIKGDACYYSKTVEPPTRTPTPFFCDVQKNVGSCSACNNDGEQSCSITQRNNPPGCTKLYDDTDGKDPKVSYSCPRPTTVPGAVVPPTNTPTPTSTPVPPGSVTLNLDVDLEGISSNKNLTSSVALQSFDVELLNKTNNSIAFTKPANQIDQLAYDKPTGKFKKEVNLGPNVPQGEYLIRITIPRYLVKTIASPKTITKINEVQKISASTTLIAGDTDSNNEINLIDYNKALECFGSRQCPDKTIADINKDGKVDIIDLNIIFRNYGLTGD